MADKHRIGAFCRREDIKFRNYGRDQELTVMEKYLIFLHPNHQSQPRSASRKRETYDMDIPEGCKLWDLTKVVLEG